MGFCDCSASLTAWRCVQAPVKLGDLIRGKRVVLFAVPGPFTPGCTKSHAPGFLQTAHELHAKGIQGVYCVSASDGEGLPFFPS